jgi:REP element-mobilizing transposase RayT
MRPLRVKVLESAYYHVTSRALERRFIFDDVAAAKFIGFMREVETFSGVQVVTYGIMSNHIHLLLKVPSRQEVSDEEMLARLRQTFSPLAYTRFMDKWNRMRKQGSQSGLDALRQGVLQRMYDLSFFMKELKQRFSTWYNFREKRRGPVWEDRFKSSLIEHKPGYLATAAAYIDNNPVRAGLVKDAKDYRFCGYAAALAGDETAQAGLAVITAAYGVSGSADLVLRRYRLLLVGKGVETSEKPGYSNEEMESVFAAQGAIKPWELAKHRLRWLTDGAIIGSKEFVAEMRTRLGGKLKRKRATGAYTVADSEAWCALKALRGLD